MAILGSDLFLSPSKKKEKADNYFHKMFPLGEKQQDWENKTIDVLFSKNKKRIPTIKYICFIRREYYIDGIKLLEDEKLLKRFRRLLKNMKISEDELKIIESFVKLEYEAKVLNDLPTPEKIIAYSKEFDYGYQIVTR